MRCKLMRYSIAKISGILGYKNAHIFDEQPRVNQWHYIRRLPSSINTKVHTPLDPDIAQNE